MFNTRKHFELSVCCWRLDDVQACSLPFALIRQPRLRSSALVDGRRGRGTSNNLSSSIVGVFFTSCGVLCPPRCPRPPLLPLLLRRHHPPPPRPVKSRPSTTPPSIASAVDRWAPACGTSQLSFVCCCCCCWGALVSGSRRCSCVDVFVLPTSFLEFSLFSVPLSVHKVVVDLATAVKELVENSLDAGR